MTGIIWAFSHSNSLITICINQDIDPENNFFDNLNNNCCHYLDQFNMNTKPSQEMSVIHCNRRSLNTNIQNVKVYLSHLLLPSSNI